MPSSSVCFLPDSLRHHSLHQIPVPCHTSWDSESLSLSSRGGSPGEESWMLPGLPSKGLWDTGEGQQEPDIRPGRRTWVLHCGVMFSSRHCRDSPRRPEAPLCRHAAGETCGKEPNKAEGVRRVEPCPIKLLFLGGRGQARPCTSARPTVGPAPISREPLLPPSCS